MEDLLIEYRNLGASDLHIRENRMLCFRKEGELYFTKKIFTKEEIEEFLQKEIGVNNIEKDFDVSFQDFENNRYRINVSSGEEGYFLSIRIIPSELPNINQEMYDVFNELSKIQNGFVLVTGSTGAGKSTTLRFFLEEFNKNYAKKIICLEDPIEYFYQEKKSIFFQREIGRDSADFVSAMKATLRQDPDIVVIGEIRDKETLDASLYLAESGHLVFSSLHTENCIDSIHKMLAFSSSEKQLELRQRLANLLRFMIAQELIKKGDGDRVAIFEILKNTKAVANMISSGRELQLTSILESSGKEGMCTKEQCRKKYDKELQE